MPLTRSPIREIDGIACFAGHVPDEHPDYNSSALDKLYAGEKTNFWFVSRRNRIIKTIQRYLPEGKRILEIGAGTGYIAEGLIEHGYRVAVGELHLSGLQYARKKGVRDCYQFDLFDPPFSNEFDAVGMFDVLEHLEKDIYALECVAGMLKPKGRLFIAVPAHVWLWNRDDAIASHKRRYNKELLAERMNQAGLEVVDIRYFFITILPLLYLRHLLNRDSGGEITRVERDKDIRMNGFINRILFFLTEMENYFWKWMPNIAGGSLLCVAEKRS